MGLTALMYATINEETGNMALLLQRGADVYIQDTVPTPKTLCRCPAFYTVLNKQHISELHIQYGGTALEHARMQNLEPEVALLERGE
jgi:ankyrin repeat protein